MWGDLVCSGESGSAARHHVTELGMNKTGAAVNQDSSQYTDE